MKLYTSPTSPYGRKAHILILELELQDEIEIANKVPMENPEDLQASNPIGKVPCLVFDDGQSLYDSPVICEYIDAQNRQKFVPAKGDARWDCLRRQGLGDGILDACFSRTMERLRPQDQRSELWLGRWRDAISRGVDVLSSDLSNTGDRFDLGDVTAACALGYLDLRHGDLEWRNGRDELATWFETVSKRASVAATKPA